MSESKEQEKLTPASRKSYYEYMAEESIEPERAKNAEGEIIEGEEQKNEDREQRKQRREAGEARDVLKKLLRKLVTSNLQEDDTKAVAGAVVKLISSENNEKSQQINPKKEVAKLVLLIKQPDELTPGSSREAREASVEEPPIVEAIYEAAEKQGMDRGAIEEIVEEEEEKQLPLQEKARFNKFDTFIEEKLEPASEDALKNLKKDLQKVKTKDKEITKTVDRADALLKDIIDEVEQQDDKATSEEDLQRDFADVVASYINSSVQNGVEKEMDEETDAISEQEQKQAEIMINMLLKPGDSAENKSELIAALIHEYYPLYGQNAQKNEQARQFVMHHAERAGLDPKGIEQAELAVGLQPRVSELNAFEQRVTKQIMDATPDEVIEIQKSWREILENAGEDTEIGEIAQEAVEVLGHIIKFKLAKARGGRMDPRMFAKPKYLQQKEHEDNLLDESEEEAKAKLVKLFVTMFSEAKSVDKDMIVRIASFVIESENTYDGQVNKINTLLSCIPNVTKTGREGMEASHVMGVVQEVAMDKGLKFHDIGLVEQQDSEMSAKNRQEKLQEVFAESLENSTAEEMTDLQDTLKKDIEEKKVRAYMAQFVEDAVEQLETVSAANQDSAANTEKKEPQEKPFTLVLEEHRDDENTSDKLLEWRDNIKKKLLSQPDGKILILLEHGDISREESEAITKAISEGALPSAELDALPRNKPSERYLLTRNRILDELNKDYPGRLHVVTEWRPTDHPGDNMPDVSDITTEADITDSRIESLQKKIVEHAKLLRARNDHMAKIIADNLNNNEDIIGGVGLVGTAHTPVSFELKNQGYNVNRVFGDKEEGVTMLSPYAAYVRELELLADKQPSDAELKLVLRAEMRLQSKRTGDANEHELLKDAHRWMREQRNLPEFLREEAAENPEENVYPRRVRELTGMFSMQSVAEAPHTPLVVKGDRGEEYRITDANRRILNTVTDPVALEKLIPEGMSPEDAEKARQELASIANPEILNNAQNLALMQQELQKMEALHTKRHRNEDGSPSYQSMTDMRNLALAINEQREALQAMMGYNGIDQEGSDLDQSLYGGDIHEALGERMRRIKVRFGEEPSKDHENYSDEELIAYYEELKVWANTILDNDKRRNPGKESNKGILDLDNTRYQKFLDFTKSKITDVNAQRGEILENINYMLRRDPAGGDMLRYFMKNTPDPELGLPEENSRAVYTPENKFNPEKLLGVPYQRPQELGGMGDTPRTLKDTMHTIAEEFSNDKNNFHPGGNRELIDAQGNFHYENFIYWIRLKINEDVDYNNDAPIQPFGKIIIKLPMSQISMFELLLLIPEFSSQRRLEIKHEEGGGVRAGWGTKAEHPKLSWANLDFIGQEMEFRQMTHEARIKFVNNEISGSKKSFLDLMNELHGSNNWVRSSNIFRLLGYPSSVVNGSQEVDDWLDNDKEKQGSIGKSMCDMIVAYYYLSELTDYHKKKYRDHHGKGIEREKNFNENMFYRFWEPDGSNKFLIKMAEGALNVNNDARSMYVDFVQKRLSAAEQAFLHKPGLNEEQQEKIKQMAHVQKEKLQELQEGSKNIKIDINFTESEHLLNLHKLIERDVLKSGKVDEQIAIDVRNEMVDNLKEEYFKPLVNMTVARIDLVDSDGNRVDEQLYPIDENGDRIPNKKPIEKKPKDRDSTVSFLRTFGKIRFGDIAVDRNSKGKTTLTMEQLLLGDGTKEHPGFDVKQIYRFDYSNNKNSLLYKDNPFRSELDKADVDKDHSDTLRRMIDAFMDPNNEVGEVNHKLFRQNEKMMLAFTKHVAQIKREELNHFRDQHENTLARDMIARAFRSCVERVHGIDSTESEYAWWWTRDYVYLWGIGATLDVTGIGFRQDGKLFNTGIWRPRRQAKDGGGNPDTYDEFLAMSLPFLHHVRVHNTHREDPLGHRSIFYYLQGGEGSHITPRAVREFDPRSYYRFEQGAEQQYVKNTLNSGSELLELLSQTEFDMTKILEFDIHGNVVFDYGKAREIFGKWRGAIRYAYGKNKLDYREKIWSNGREKTLYEHFFGPKTRALNDLITQRVDKHTVDRLYKEPFDAVMMSIIAAEVHEHRKMFSSGHHWSIQNVIELERFLLEFMEEKGQEEDYDGVRTTKSKGQLLTRELFRAGLNAYHTGYAKMYAVEFNSSFWAAVFGGLWEGLKASARGIKTH